MRNEEAHGRTKTRGWGGEGEPLVWSASREVGLRERPGSASLGWRGGVADRPAFSRKVFLGHVLTMVLFGPSEFGRAHPEVFEPVSVLV